MNIVVNNVKLEEIYDTLLAWWKGHNFPALSPDFLSDEVFVCYNDDSEPTYSICLYHTNSNLCWVGFPVSNPNLSKEDKEGCFDALIQAVLDYSRQAGYKFVFTTSPVKVVQDKLLNFGFDEGDVQVNHYIKKL